MATMKKSQKEMKVGSFQDLPPGKMVIVNQGEARIHQGEFAGHTSDFNAGFQSVVDAIHGQKTTVTVEGWHGTRYR